MSQFFNKIKAHKNEQSIKKWEADVVVSSGCSGDSETRRVPTFAHFEQWQDVFEPEVKRNRLKEEEKMAKKKKQQENEEARRNTRLGQAAAEHRSHKREKFQDKVLSEISSAVSTKVCNSIVEGIVEALEKCDTYIRNMSLSTLQYMIENHTNVPSKVVNDIENTVSSEMHQLLVDVRSSLLQVLNSFLGLLMTFRFSNPNAKSDKQKQIQHLRDLAGHAVGDALSLCVSTFKMMTQRSVLTALEGVEKGCGVISDGIATGEREMEALPLALADGVTSILLAIRLLLRGQSQWSKPQKTTIPPSSLCVISFALSWKHN